MAEEQISVKISELAETNNFNDDDELPLVQNGTTKKIKRTVVVESIKADLGSAAQAESSDFEPAGAVQAVESQLNQKTSQQNERIERLEYSIYLIQKNGVFKAYRTKSLMLADVAIIPVNSIISVVNDPANNAQTNDINGEYHYNGTDFFKLPNNLLDQLNIKTAAAEANAKSYADVKKTEAIQTAAFDAQIKADEAEQNAKQFSVNYYLNYGFYTGKSPAEYDRNGIVLRYFDNFGNMYVSSDIYANNKKLINVSEAQVKIDLAENNAKQYTTQSFINNGLYSGNFPSEYDKYGIFLRYFDQNGNMIVSNDIIANNVKLIGLQQSVDFKYSSFPAQISNDNIMPMSFDKFGRLIAIPHPNFSKQVIEQTKSAVDTSSIVSSTNIVLFGDSITATGSGYGDAFMLEVQADRTVINRGIGGQDTREIVQRQGGVPIPVAAFTMPASGSVSVTLTNGDCYYQKGGTYAATINDMAITVAPTSTQNVWTVTRVNAGAATAIPAGSIIILDEQKSFRNHTLILQPGPNWNVTTSVFTETQILQTIEYTAAAINYLAPKIKKFLIIGEYATANYSQDISNYLNTVLKYNALLREFSPANFFDIHKYGSTQAIYDAQKLGLISSITSQDLADMAAGYVPNSLTVDGTHPTAAFKTVLAKRIALTLKIRGI
ncbi:hypothetical protein KTN00_03325 [Acinetobacter soli]|uniref:SGNH/GDSL hydrolase family protein n=1 Tax=Acinetobacter soli TaxID=487316 RepID=UPI001C461383|nr:SGNH/GDSL hydrolase family protein [Acinetobacter soli]MBV6550061.1 hypothetical protein [Acinetobacter soli]